MIKNNNALDFMDLRLSFRDDPKFVHLEDTLKALIYSVANNLSVPINIVKNQHFMEGNMDIKAGIIYNNYMMRNPYNTNTTHADEITDDAINIIATVFKTTMEKNDRLKIYALEIDDPLECMFEFCHFLFIPVRFQISTLSKDIKINSLRKWLTVISSLPLNKSYTSKYIDAISNIQKLHQISDKLLEDESIVKKIESLNYEFIRKAVSSMSYASMTINPTLAFIKLYGNIILIATLEILKVWCPNILECIRINPNYDGSWINPFDQMCNDQYTEITKLMQLFNTKT